MKVVCDTNDAMVMVEEGKCVDCCGAGLPRGEEVGVNGGRITSCAALHQQIEAVRPLARRDVAKAAKRPVRTTQYVDA